VSEFMPPWELAVLSDALEEAGVPDQMVAHLRGLGPHVQGCHVVDLCLGPELSTRPGFQCLVGA
jgi:hypothetical protein